MSGHDHLGDELLKSADGVPDDRLEQRVGRVEPTDDGVQFLDAGQALGVGADVDDAACPQPVSTTSPRPATWAINAWSCKISGSGSQLPPRQAWLGQQITQAL